MSGERNYFKEVSTQKRFYFQYLDASKTVPNVMFAAQFPLVVEPCTSKISESNTQKNSKNMMMLVGSMWPVWTVKKYLHVRQMTRALCPSIRESRNLTEWYHL